MLENHDAHVAIVTGANHGIGAATAAALAADGVAVLCAYWLVDDPADPAVPAAYGRHRAADADSIVSAIRDRGGQAIAVAQDLRDPQAAARLFDTAEDHLGPVDILVNNASGWVQDTFAPHTPDQIGRTPQPVTRGPGQSSSASTRWRRPCSSPSSPAGTRTAGRPGAGSSG